MLAKLELTYELSGSDPLAFRSPGIRNREGN